MIKWIGVLGFAGALILFAAPTGVYAQEDSEQAAQPEEDSSGGSSAADQLDDAAQDGQEAVDAPTDEDAKAESNETFDTPHDADGN
jgi:hypothetical protein